MISVVRLCLTFLLVFAILPLGMGCALVKGNNKIYIMAGGLGASFVAFQILALIFHVTLGSFRLMIGIWLLICGAIAIIGYKNHGKVMLEKTKKRELGNIHLDCIEIVLLLLALGLVLAQVMNTVYSEFLFCSDDNTYIGTAVTAWYTDTVDRYSPAGGWLQPVFYKAQYVIACSPVYGGMLGVLSGINPTIILRTILPVAEIPLAYAVTYLLIRYFLGNNKKKCLLALLYVQIFTIMAADKVYAFVPEWWLIVYNWTGKAIMAVIYLPLILWLMIRMEQETAPQEQSACKRALMLVCWSSGFIAASSFYVVPVELAIWGIFYLFRTKKRKEIPQFILYAAPCLLCALLS